MPVMRRLSVVLVSLPLVVGGLWPQSAGASTLRVVAKGHAPGRYAVANTNGQIKHPSKIELSVSSTPALSGLVQWSVECEKGSKLIPSKNYKKTVKLPATVVIAFTPSSSVCAVAANVQLLGSGTVTITLDAAN